jgi:hypothetical protein
MMHKVGAKNALVLDWLDPGITLFLLGAYALIFYHRYFSICTFWLSHSGLFDAPLWVRGSGADARIFSICAFWSGTTPLMRIFVRGSSGSDPESISSLHQPRNEA